VKAPEMKNIQNRCHSSTNREEEILGRRTHPSVFTTILLLK
jgi:hypothetical protein